MTWNDHKPFGESKESDEYEEPGWVVPLWLQIAFGVFVGMLMLHIFEYAVAREFAIAAMQQFQLPSK